MTSRLVVFATIVLTSVGLASARQEPTATKATGSVAGTVTVDGKPASGVTVVLTESSYEKDQKPAGTAVVDKEGAFRIDGAPIGKLRLVVDAPGLVVDDVANTGVLVTENETTKVGELKLRRGGVITGRITNKDEVPIVGQLVSLFRLGDDGKSQMVPLYGVDQSMSRTDDRGIYRLYGLLPGTYLVAAGAGEGEMSFGSSGRSYARAYFPGVATEGEARRVTVAVGVEATSIDFSLADKRAAVSVSGRIVDGDTGAPVAEAPAGFGIMVNGKFTGSFGYGNVSNKKGEFAIGGIAPGSYGFTAYVQGKYSEPVLVDVGTSDVTGIEITIRRGGSISGVATIENAEGRASEELKRLAVLAKPASTESGDDENRPGAIGYSTLAADGAFHIEGLKPGSYLLEPSGMSEGSTATLVRVERDGAAVDAPFEIATGDAIDNVHVVFAVGAGVVRGRVTYSKAIPRERYGIVAMRSASSQLVAKRVDIDNDGAFVFDQIPPGDYVVQAVVRIYTSSGVVVETLRSEEKRITVEASSRLDVDLLVKTNDEGGQP